MWIARDLNEDLYLYNECPIKDEEFDCFHPDYDEGCESMALDKHLFDWLTYEDSPVEVELKLITNES